jgi:aryl-alcohol dehydrogenase-like predicted oxidoreductase
MSAFYGFRDDAESSRVLNRSLELGMNFWDTAEMYEAFNTGWIPRTLTRTQANTTPTTLEELGREVFAPAFRQSELQAA